MHARHSSQPTSSNSGGFTLIELLVAMVLAMATLGAFTSFYLGQQRTLRRHQLEIAASQSLRNALEQISRDLRSAGLDPTTMSGAGITLADSDEVDFTLDADADGTVSASDGAETKRFRRTGGFLESYVAGTTSSWLPLADSVAPGGAVFRFFRCDGSEVTALPASATDRASVARIEISLAVNGTGGMTFLRRQSESVRLRNKDCS